MVINDRYRFIFVHVPKAAGTSVMKALRTLDGDNRERVSERTKHETLWELRERHASTGGRSDRASVAALDGYFTFGFVRHPWERLCSLYFYLQERSPRPEIAAVASFAAFVRKLGEGEPWIRGLHSLRPQVDFFRASPGGGIDADFIGRFEHFADDFRAVTSRLALPPIALPHVNRSSNAVRDYRRLYSDETIRIVERIFVEDIQAFGYVFDDPAPSARWQPCHRTGVAADETGMKNAAACPPRVREGAQK